MRLRGRVRWFRSDLNYGFVVSSSGLDLFLHGRDLDDGFELERGDFVEFTVSETDSGRPCAANIVLVIEST